MAKSEVKVTKGRAIFVVAPLADNLEERAKANFRSLSQQLQYEMTDYQKIIDKKVV